MRKQCVPGVPSSSRMPGYEATRASCCNVARLKKMMATSFRIENAIRGDHVFKRVWTPHAGETLLLRAEHGNTVDRFAVAVVTGSNIVGHVPMEYSRVFWYFIQKCHISIVCKINGSRCLSEVSGKGLEVLCEYIHLYWSAETRSEANLSLRKTTRVATTLVTTGSSQSHHSHKKFPLTILILSSLIRIIRSRALIS